MILDIKNRILYNYTFLEFTELLIAWIQRYIKHFQKFFIELYINIKLLLRLESQE
jgi:hypothetical protein